MGIKLSSIINSEFEEIVDFRGTSVFLRIKPDVYTFEDKLAFEKAVSNDTPDDVFAYAAKGLVDWGVIDENGARQDIVDENDEKIAITAENLKALIPESFASQVVRRIENLKESTAGKPKPPVK